MHVADVDENRLEGELPRDYVQRLALQKAETIWRSLPDDRRRPVLGADTTVCIADEILGKPADRGEGVRMLQSTSIGRAPSHSDGQGMCRAVAHSNLGWKAESKLGCSICQSLAQLTSLRSDTRELAYVVGDLLVSTENRVNS